mmetsp:Transcript_27207/g.56304  ORF Transcript_27207/g.56304 Transcript_27207/m.56304 type:complete len:88 (-) Transcript_27207:197-460(-)
MQTIVVVFVVMESVVCGGSTVRCKLAEVKGTDGKRSSERSKKSRNHYLDTPPHRYTVVVVVLAMTGANKKYTHLSKVDYCYLLLRLL